MLARLFKVSFSLKIRSGVAKNSAVVSKCIILVL